jgi:3-hydroxyisobutyrate dehydrogenase-like beta-hydroxyacid dehydrogenase
MKIGFIGPGRMGAAMAANLVKARHDVMLADDRAVCHGGIPDSGRPR